MRSASRAAPNRDYSNLFRQNPNTEGNERTRCPLGWLVVVEGRSIGEWFVLERGVTRVGSSEGDTIRLKSDTGNVVPIRPVSVAFDEESHIFVLESPTESGARVNGEKASAHSVLRDGDVITIGETSFRLAAFCSPNFHWDERHFGT